MKKAVTIIIILAIVAIGSWKVVSITRSRAEASQKVEEPLTAVEVQMAMRSAIREELSLVGNIVADSEVTVLPEVGGKLIHISVDEGSKVKKGEVIARIEDKELTLRVRQTEAALKAAAVAFDQARSLSEVNVRSQIAQAGAGLASAEAALEQVRDLAERKTLSQLEQAEAGLEALKANLKKARVGGRDEEKRQVEATVQQARASLDNAKADLERMENLYAKRGVSKQTLDAARMGAKVADAQYEAALQQLKMVETGAREEDIVALESQVKQAEAVLELAKSTAEARSWEKDIEIAQAGYNRAKAALESAKTLEKIKSWEAEISAAETMLEQAQVALELAEEALSNATVTAPIDGLISERFGDEGDMASPGAPLFTIVSMDKVKAVVNITESRIAGVSLDNIAYVSVEAFPDEQVEGRITMISPTLKIGSRTATAEITIDNPSHKLKPGMFASVTIPVKIHEDALIVRRSALIENETSGDRHLFVVNNGVAARRDIETGIMNGNIIEVLSGLLPGEKVVVSGQNYLDNDKPVRVVKISG